MTAHYLHEPPILKPGDTALVHAAAGGVGQILVQIAKKCGARVIATVSNEEKAKIARRLGADEVILYTSEDFEAEVKRLTDGKGLEVVYDGVGKETLQRTELPETPRLYGVALSQRSHEPINPGCRIKGALF